jgi:hypothetical protein
MCVCDLYKGNFVFIKYPVTYYLSFNKTESDLQCGYIQKTSGGIQQYICIWIILYIISVSILSLMA